MVNNYVDDLGEMYADATATGNECAVVPTTAVSGGLWRVSGDPDGKQAFVKTE
jgi:hypothetical protein